jgi:hypothetical protein
MPGLQTYYDTKDDFDYFLDPKASILLFCKKKNTRARP